jgi:aminoglycoside phosphotransferase (APT) family kinase protein
VQNEEIRSRLVAWLAERLPDADDVRIEGIDRVDFGHSAETILLTLAWKAGGAEHREDVVLRMRPPPPGLLEPYDLRRQFQILRGLERTPVRAPRALWLEDSGDVLGREFYVMERRSGTVYERSVPEELAAAPERIRRMSEGIVEQIAAIHSVDLRTSGLAPIGDGRDHLERELEHWSGEMRRLQRGPLPALERLWTELCERKPERCPTVTLVHGDAKPGNFAFEGDEVSAVFDWEMATVGDPLADIGWTESLWRTPGSFTSLPGALTPDELVARYEQLTGISVRHREWYRAFQQFKLTVILFVGGMLFHGGFTDDLRLAQMGRAVHPMTLRALRELGVEADLEPGPVSPSEERIRAVRSAGSRDR